MQAVDRLAQHLGIDDAWREHPAAQAVVTENDDFLLAKTLQYDLGDVEPALAMAADALGATAESATTVLTYDPTLMAGETEYDRVDDESLRHRVARRGLRDMFAETIADQVQPLGDVFDSPRWKVLSIGINSEESYSRTRYTSDRAFASGFAKRNPRAKSTALLRLHNIFSDTEQVKVEKSLDDIVEYFQAWSDKQEAAFEAERHAHARAQH
jgi:hypothetical protein